MIIALINVTHKHIAPVCVNCKLRELTSIVLFSTDDEPNSGLVICQPCSRLLIQELQKINELSPTSQA